MKTISDVLCPDLEDEFVEYVKWERENVKKWQEYWFAKMMEWVLEEKRDDAD